MAAQMGGTPILVLPEGYRRYLGRDAQRTNILAARVIGEAVRTTLGPRGMDKMLVDQFGDVVVTNDGATILDEIEVEHPAAKMMVEVAKTQDDEVGDGTTTAVVLAAELLKRAEELLDQGIHPTIIVSGYRKAASKAIEILGDISKEVNIDDDEELKRIAITSMNSKGVEAAKEHLAEIAVKAVKMIMEKENGGFKVDTDYIKLEKKEGESLFDTELINGIVIDKEVVHPGMPKRIENAKIAILNCPIEVKETETDAEIRIHSPDQLKAFLEEEERMLKEMVDKIKEAGANVVFTQKGIDDLAQHYLAKAGIMAVRRVKKSDIEKLSRATGGRIVTRIEDLTPDDLGEAGLVEEKKIAGDEMIFVRDCKNPKAVSILIRGGTEHVVDEAERALNDAINVVADVIEENKIVPGGGAVEIELAKRIREYAETIGGREQLAIEAFANAMEIVPMTLAENGGLDAIDIVVELRAKHEEQDGKAYGVNVLEGKVSDMFQLGVVEPLKVKKQAIKSASEAAQMILRIDDIIAASKMEKEKEGEEGGEEEESGTEF